MSKIKIKSNPYEKQITYWKKGSADADWRQITYGDEFKSYDLIKDNFRENYFTNVMNEVFPVLVDEFGDRQNKLEVEFEGVSEEYDGAYKEVKSKYSNDIKFLRGEYFLKSVDDVLKFETDVANEIKKSIPENYIEEFESSITEILKNLKNESANKYQVAMDTKSSLEKLNNDIEKNIGDEIDSRKKEQREVETKISDTKQHKESAIKDYNERITEFNNFVDEVKKKDVIDVKKLLEYYLEYYSVKAKLFRIFGKSEDEIKKEITNIFYKEFSKRIQTFCNDTDKQLQEHIQNVRDEVKTFVANNEQDIIYDIPKVKKYGDEILKKFENSIDLDKDDSDRKFLPNVLKKVRSWGILRYVRLVPPVGIFVDILESVSEMFDAEEIKKQLDDFNTKFASEFSKWYDKNIHKNVEKYFADNQRKMNRFFSTKLQKLENTKNELGGQIEQLNGYLEVLDCYNKEINGLFQWKNSK